MNCKIVKKDILQKFKTSQGTTLLELITAISLFSIIFLSATQIFQLVVNGQRNAMATQNIEEAVRYTFEVMAKEMRYAQRDLNNDCSGGIFNQLDTHVYYVPGPGNQLAFKNFNGQCVRYYRSGFYLEIERDGISENITPDEIRLVDIDFVASDDWEDLPLDFQSSVTINFEFEARNVPELHKSPITIQTTISSRYYED